MKTSRWISIFCTLFVIAAILLYFKIPSRSEGPLNDKEIEFTSQNDGPAETSKLKGPAWTITESKVPEVTEKAGPKEIKGLCLDRWPGGHEKQRACQDAQDEGFRVLDELAVANGLIKDGYIAASPSGPGIQRIVYECMKENAEPQFKTYDFKLVVDCLKQRQK